MSHSILTAAHCITHTDSGKVELQQKLRIRVPKPKFYHIEKNIARKGFEDDKRLYDFWIENPDQFHVYPSYFEVGNPHEGDDLGLIVLKEKSVIDQLLNLGTFLESNCYLNMAMHKGNL